MLVKTGKIKYAIVGAFVLVSILGITALLSGTANSQEITDLDPDKMHYFYGRGCPHCANVDEFFTQTDAYSKYPIQKHEVYGSADNAELLSEMFDYIGVPQNLRGVPAVFYGFTKARVGDKPVIDNFEIDVSEFTSAVKTGTNPRPEIPEQQGQNQEAEKKSDLTILAVTAAAFVDSINPCAFAVLILLMTSVLSSGGGKRALSAGLLFALSVFLSYLAMGLGLYQALSLGNFSLYFLKIVGWLAILIGLLNIKDYFWYGKGFLMEVPQSWRPKMKSIIRGVTSPIGAFGTGFIVSLFLLPCTSGPYIVILGMLSRRHDFYKALSYLIYYNAIFVLPMVIITIAVHKGLNPKKAEEARQGKLRILHLIAGVILILMGLAVLLGWI